MPSAIVSVYDKTNLERIGYVLNSKGYDIYATPGTYRYLQEHHIPANEIEEYCKNPPGYNCFFSSLSFNSLVGVLSADNVMVFDSVVKKIDIVVYNFVPTWDIISNVNDFNIANVDLGGPAIVRAAAINYLHTLPIVSPSQYPIIEQDGAISDVTRLKLAKDAFDYCSWYDQQSSRFLASSL